MPNKEYFWKQLCLFCHFMIDQSGEVVALKKVSLRKLEDGIPNTALRYTTFQGVHTLIMILTNPRLIN